MALENRRELEMGRRRRQVVPLSGDGLRLEALIDIILRCHPMSLRILAGEYEPTTDELSEILECLSRGAIDVPRGVVRFCGSSEEEVRVIRAEAFEGVLVKVGGWSGLAAAAKRFAEAYPKTWAIIEDHVTWGTGRSFSRMDEPQLERVASRHGLAPETVQRYRREFPGHLARLALRG